IIPTVPPTVKASTDRTRGEAVYVGWPGSASTRRHRTQPARCRASVDVWCDGGMWITTSPALFSPPVSSRSTSHADQPDPFHASHTSGGRRGSTPAPATRQSSRIATAQDGTASDRPTSNASPPTGDSEKQENPAGPASPPVRSFGLAA